MRRLKNSILFLKQFSANEMKAGNLVMTKRMQMYLLNEIIHFQNKQLVPTNVNLAMMFICKLFQSRLQVGQFKSYDVSTGLVHVKTIAVFITHVQYLAVSQQHTL